MRIPLKALTAPALGLILAIGSVAPSLALGGPSTALRAAGQSDAAPKVEVRGGVRYDQLQTSRQGRESDVWIDESAAPRGRGVILNEQDSRVEGYL